MVKYIFLCLLVAVVGGNTSKNKTKPEDRDLQYHVNVTYLGKLTCDGGGLHTVKPPVEIRLWEKRLGQHAWFYPDELLAKVEASEDGKYQISGTIDYWWSPESYLEIFHTCGGECRKIELTSEKNVTSLELLHVGSDCRAKLKSPK